MSPSIVERYKSTLLILGIVIFIAGCLYMQVCKSCVDSYHNPEDKTLVLYRGHRHSAQRCLPSRGLAPHRVAPLVIEIILVKQLSLDARPASSWPRQSSPGIRMSGSCCGVPWHPDVRVTNSPSFMFADHGAHEYHVLL